MAIVFNITVEYKACEYVFILHPVPRPRSKCERLLQKAHKFLCAGLTVDVETRKLWIAHASTLLARVIDLVPCEVKRLKPTPIMLN